MEAGYTDNPTVGNSFCAAGFDTLNIIFIISLLIDIACQVSAFTNTCLLILTLQAVHVLLNMAVFKATGTLQVNEGAIRRRQVASTVMYIYSLLTASLGYYA